MSEHAALPLGNTALDALLSSLREAQLAQVFCDPSGHVDLTLRIPDWCGRAPHLRDALQLRLLRVDAAAQLCAELSTRLANGENVLQRAVRASPRPGGPNRLELVLDFVSVDGRARAPAATTEIRVVADGVVSLQTAGTDPAASLTLSPGGTR